MKKRERRRYFTEKYQQKQVRLANQLRRYQPYDTQRYLQRPLAIKQRFFDLLCGREIGHTWNERERRSNFDIMLGGYCGELDPFTKAQLGRFRNHSFSDCGRPRCPGCSNPRRGNGYESPQERITLQERVAEHRMKEDLDLYNKGEYDEEV